MYRWVEKMDLNACFYPALFAHMADLWGALRRRGKVCGGEGYMEERESLGGKL